MGTSESKSKNHEHQNQDATKDSEFQRNSTKNSSFLKSFSRRSFKGRKSGRDIVAENTDEFKYVTSLSNQSPNQHRDRNLIECVGPNSVQPPGSDNSSRETPNASPFSTNSRHTTPAGSPFGSRNSSFRNRPAPIYQNQLLINGNQISSIIYVNSPRYSYTSADKLAQAMNDAGDFNHSKFILDEGTPGNNIYFLKTHISHYTVDLMTSLKTNCMNPFNLKLQYCILFDFI